MYNKQLKNFKTYQYRDLLVQVPGDITHLGICSDGVLRAWRGEPDFNQKEFWKSDNSIIPVILNWPKSICATETLTEYAPLVLHELAPAGQERYNVGDKYPIHQLINDEELCLASEVHVVVSCYTPGMMLWCQVLKLKIEGLSIDNILLATVKEIMQQLE